MVSRKKNLLLRFDNLRKVLNSLTTICVSYFAATLTRYVRVSASVAFLVKVLFKLTVFYQE